MRIRFNLMYPEFKSKAFTFSYDDGVVQDLKLVEIFRKYGIKGTFNLNSGLQNEIKFRDGKYTSHIDCHRLDLNKYKDSYAGFEIASHSLTHPFLQNLDYSKQNLQIKEDVENLEKIFSKKISGFAYPYGTYDENTLKALKANNIKYARTTRSTYSFHPPYNFLLWHPTIHHNEDKLFELLDLFFHSYEELSVFYLWGHSYEFSLDDNFDLIEKVSKVISSHTEIYKASNMEICDYIQAANEVYYADHKLIGGGYFINPSDKDIYLITEYGDKIVLHAKERLKYEKN